MTPERFNDLLENRLSLTRDVLGSKAGFLHLGNAVVPQIPELIGNAILDAIGWRDAA